MINNTIVRTLACIFLGRKINSRLFENRIKLNYSTDFKNVFDIEDKKVIIMWDGSPFNPGLADKLKGCLSTYLLCKKYGIRNFYINWTQPFKLEDYLHPNIYDWRIDETSIHRLAGFTNPIMIQKLANILFQEKIDEWLFRRRIVKLTQGEYHLYTNMVYNSNEFKEAFEELFTPSLSLRSQLSHHKQNLGRYVSFSFRFMNLLGDFHDEDGFNDSLEEQDAINLMDRCYIQLKSIINTLPDGIKAFVASDSLRFLNHVKLNPYIYIVNGETAHLKFQTSPNIISKTFIDLLLISGAEKVYLMKTGNMYESGFPWLASKIGGKPFEVVKF